MYHSPLFQFVHYYYFYCYQETNTRIENKTNIIIVSFTCNHSLFAIQVHSRARLVDARAIQHSCSEQCINISHTIHEFLLNVRLSLTIKCDGISFFLSLQFSVSYFCYSNLFFLFSISPSIVYSHSLGWPYSPSTLFLHSIFFSSPV